ncbi:MAG: alpha-mannosidase [Oscillospiraceae bacterium]|nr:alpha-mannosidase [Oscillospiraceae bacterium]
MKRTLYLTGAGHLDPVWLWSWREGYQANRATLRSALDRMKDFPDMVFTTTSAQFYEWIEENDPAMFEEIRARVREGRWNICGGWWIQPDCNVPSGESFARQALLAQRYFSEKFGVTAVSGLCPDSFGHNAMLPQLLKKSGMSRYIFMRPMPGEKDDLPSRLFLWESPDGSRVVTYRLPVTYHLGAQPKKGFTMADLMDQIVDEPPYGVGNMLGFYGVGNHGGGPTVQHLRDIEAYAEARKDSLDVKLSGTDAFFDELDEASLPVYRGELHYHAAGSYAACSMIKRMNRRAENALLSAEKFDALGTALGVYTRREGLDRAWKNVLFNQFHDTLAGSATEAAYFDARNQLGEAIAIADRCENGAMQAISSRIDIPKLENTLPVVVFNPHGWDVCEPVELEMGMFRTLRLPSAYKLLDSEGREVPFQFVDCPSKVFTRCTVTFRASVPALGWATFRFVEAESMQPYTVTDAHALENEFLRVMFDEKRGTVASIFDKRLGKEVVGASRARVIFDDTDTWGHTLKSLDNEIGEFGNAQCIPLDTGAVRTAIRYRSYYGDSILTQTYALYAGEDKLRVDVKLDWREKRCALKLDYPVNTASPIARAAMPFGYIEKANKGHEEPMQSWADITGIDCGLALLNDGKYSVDFRGNVIGLTALRSPIYTHHDPRPVEPDTDYNYMDQGVQTFAYALKPHGAFDAAAVWRDAMLLNQKPYAMLETFHGGALPQRAGHVSVSAENVLLTALKQGQDGGDVLRLFETRGETADAAIRFADTSFTAHFSPFEIKTFRICGGVVTETDLLEYPL